MKNKLLLIILLCSFTGAISQINNGSLTSMQIKHCAFPDQGVIRSSIGSNDNKRGATGSFQFGNKHYYHTGGNSGNQSRLPKIFNDFSIPNNKLVDDLTLGYTYNGGDINFRVNIYENRRKVRDLDFINHQPNGNHVRVYKRKGYSQNWDIISSKESKISHKNGKKESRTRKVSFKPNGPGLYMITATYFYRREGGKNCKKCIKTAKMRMYLCIGENGSYTPEKHILNVVSSKECEKTNYRITNRKNGYTYYWSKNESTTNPNPNNVVPPGGLLLTNEKLQELDLKEGDEIYFFGVKGNTTTPLKGQTIKVIDKPEPPIYTGDKYLCDCKTVFAAQPGTGGNSVAWSINEPSPRPSYLSSTDGVKNNGTVVNLTGENEETIKNNGFIYLQSTSPLAGNVHGCKSDAIKVVFETIECVDCGSNFILERGEKYVVSAWAKQSSLQLPKTYAAPTINFDFVWSDGNKNFKFSPTGNIIDGWQKIEATFTVPVKAQEMSIRLGCNASSSSACYFDDIRIFNYEGSVVSYVFDPLTLQLSALLDKNNMFIKYSYDEEGKTVSTKLETLDGVRTTDESRISIKSAGK